MYCRTLFAVLDSTEDILNFNTKQYITPLCRNHFTYLSILVHPGSSSQRMFHSLAQLNQADTGMSH